MFTINLCYQKLIEKNKLNRLLNRIKEKYDNICQSVPALSNVHTKFINTKGFIVDKIIEVNKEEQADLIIMGTRGVRGISEFWGTKTAEICLNVTTPVLVIPYHFEYFKHDKIAFAYDLKSIHNIEDLDIVKLFSMVYNSEVHILTVHSDTSKISSEEEENIDKLKHHFKDFSPIVHIETGRNIERRVFKYLKENNISMLVVLHRSRKLLEEMFHESLTAKFAYHSDIPVLALDDRITKNVEST